MPNAETRNHVAVWATGDEPRRSINRVLINPLYGLTATAAKSHDTAFGHGHNIEQFVDALST